MKKTLLFKKRSKLLFWCFAFMFAINIQGSWGQQSFTGTGTANTYSQTFDNAGTSTTYIGSAATLPANWTSSNPTYGGFYSRSNAYASNNGNFALRNLSGGTEIAIGAKPASNTATNITFTGVNNTGAAITGFTISWNVEQYSAAATATSVNFAYNINGGSYVTAGITGTTLVTASTLTTAANLSSITSTSRSITISEINIPNTQNFSFRFVIGGASGAQAHIGIDDFNVYVTPSNAAPTASSVDITGTSNVGQVLTGGYIYSDAESNPQGTSTFKWYRADDNSGTNEAAIASATSSTYTLVAGDLGKYIRFSVVPVASAGTLTGTETFSSRVGPVGAGTTPIVTIAGTLNEATLNTSTFSMTLANETFADATLSAANFTLPNAPTGVAVSNVTYDSATSATITLAYDDTDFDTNVTNFNVTIAGAELTLGSPLTSNNLTITALAESLTLGTINTFGNQCINVLSAEQQFTISGSNLKAGNISLAALDGFTYSETASGTYTSTLSFANVAGTLTNKIIYVKFLPTVVQSYNGNIAVSSNGAPTMNRSIIGSVIAAVPQAVATNTANTITVDSAILRASSSTFGICPATSAKGFVYSITSLNSDPVFGGSNVINTTVTLGSQGSFNQTVAGLSSGVNYSYKAYLFNGNAYTYGAVQTFTTLAPPTNDNCSEASPIIVNAAAITGDLANATQSLPAILCTGTGNANDDVWFKFTTSGAGNYTILASGGSLDLVLDVREGVCDGVNIGCADNTASGNESVTVALAASSTYYVRVYDYTATNFTVSSTFSIQVVANASLSSNGTTNLNFADQHITSNSASQTFNVSGQFLTGFPGDVTVASSTVDFEVSTDNVVWNSSITLPYTSDQLASVPIYVRFAPQSTGAKIANVTISGGGATPVNIAVNGLGIFVATAATNITATSFDANWQLVQNATDGYVLDVSTLPTFGNASVAINQGFELATFPPTNWTATGWTRSTTAADVNTGNGAAVAGANSGTLTTPSIANPTSMTFFLGRSNNTTAKTLTIEVSTTSQSSGFSTIATFNHVNVPSASYDQYTVDLSAFSSEPTVFIRFTKASSTTSPWRLDDIVVNAGTASFVTGYNAKPITGQATITTIVEGLTPETQYYYRLRAVNGSVESGNSNTIAVSTLAPIPSTTWTITDPAIIPAWTNGVPTATTDAIIDADYDENETITAKDLTINTGFELVVKPTQTLSVSGNLTNNGEIIFESDDTGTARFATYNGDPVSGTGIATVERYIPAKRAWRLLTAPLMGTSNNTISANWQGTDGEGLLLFSPASLSYTGYATGGTSPNIRKYVAGAFANITDLTTEPMFGTNAADTKAFLVFPTGPSGSPNIVTGAAATTLRPKGKLITGPVTQSLNANQFTLIANPYASPINPVSLISSNINAKLWLINPSNGLGAYVTFDGNWSIEPETETDGYIQSGQGFFARTPNTTFSIIENHKVAGNSNNWFEKNANNAEETESVDKIRVVLYKQEASNWALADGILAVNQASGNNAVDAKDASKISNFNESLMFRNNTSNLSIEYRALPQLGDMQPLRMTGTTAMPYQLRIFTQEYVNSTLQPYLEDTTTGSLSAIPTDGSVVVVPFTGVISTTTNPDNRFRIVYQTNLSNVETSALVASVFPNPVTNNQLNVHLGSNTEPARFTITNLLGQAIQNGSLNNTQNVITLSTATQGFYILNITQEGKSFTTKIYVQ